MKTRDYKIGIFGIQNAGKTSILKTLKREFEFAAKLHPTKGVERNPMEFLGQKIYLWDFGGQELYRAKYLNTPVHYFDSFKYVYFVVDVQDAENIEVNVLYFKLIFKELQEYSPAAKYIILYHKADPKLELPDDVRQKFYEGISSSIENQKLQFYIYQTSIYEPFTIITAFSQPFLEQNSMYDNISRMLKSFTDSNDLEFSVVFTKNFFELGHYLKEYIDTEEFNAVLKEVFVQIENNSKESAIHLEHKDILIYSLEFNIHVGKMVLPFFTVIGYDAKKSINKEVLEEKLTKLTEDFRKMLLNINLSTLL